MNTKLDDKIKQVEQEFEILNDPVTGDADAALRVHEKLEKLNKRRQALWAKIPKEERLALRKAQADSERRDRQLAKGQQMGVAKLDLLQQRANSAKDKYTGLARAAEVKLNKLDEEEV